MKTRLPLKLNSQNGEEGLTIIEGLLAIVIVMLLIVAIGPVLAFAAATRVQSRRVEQASEVARGYIDAVKNDMTLTTKKLVPPISTTQTFDTDTISANALNCPKSNDYCNSPTSSNYKFYCVDFDGDNACTTGNIKDLVIQTSGYQPSTMGTGLTNEQKADRGYLLGVRVYRAYAFGKNVQLTAGKTAKDANNTSKNTKASIIAGGSGSLTNPLAEFTTEITGTKNTYTDWQERKK